MLACQLRIPEYNIRSETPIVQPGGFAVDQALDDYVHEAFNGTLDKTAAMRDAMGDVAHCVSVQTAVARLWGGRKRYARDAGGAAPEATAAGAEAEVAEPPVEAPQLQHTLQQPPLKESVIGVLPVKRPRELTESSGDEEVVAVEDPPEPPRAMDEATSPRPKSESEDKPPPRPCVLAGTEPPRDPTDPELDPAHVERRLYSWHISNLEFANAARAGTLSMRGWDQDDHYELLGDHVFIPGGNVRGFIVPISFRTFGFNRTKFNPVLKICVT